MALQLIESTKLDELGFPSVTVADNQNMVIMSGKLRKQVSQWKADCKDKDGKVNKEHAKYKEALAVEKAHTIGVVWQFSRLSLRSAMKLITSSQSPTVGIQNALRASLTDEQLKALAKGTMPVDKDGKEVQLSDGLSINKSGKLEVILSTWMDRPNARANSKTPVEKMATQYEKLSDAEKEALRKLMGL